MSPTLLWGVAAGLGCSGTTTQDSDNAPTVPPDRALVDLVVISLDTLRRDRIGWFGGGDTTPVLDRWFATSQVLEQHRSCSNWTYPSLLCVWTGASPTDVGFLARNTEPAPPGLETLAELLGAQGYTSHLAGAQFLFDPATALVQGFDGLSWDGEWSAEQVTAQALAAADTLSSPWFLQAHYLDPHLPYTAPAEHERRPDDLPATPYDLTDSEIVHAIIEDWPNLDEQAQADLLANVDVLYDAEVRFMDHQVGELLDGLDERGLLDRALVLFVSDHGEQFYEHGHFEHGGSLYGEETWAVAALAGPGLTAGRHTAPTNHVDLAPTVLDALGLPAAPQATGAVVGTADDDRPLFTAFVRQRVTMQGVQAGDDRLLLHWVDGEYEQYALATDPGEQSDLYDAEDPASKALVDLLWPRVERLAEMLETDVPTVD